MNQEMQVLVDGKPLKTVAHDGKLFVIARPGTQYEIRLRNNSTSRVMAVTSVDGLSVLDGEACDPSGSGYVINGLSSYTVKGWRTSNEEVKAFEFSKKDQSYAAKSENGDDSNVGVIGVAFWSEKPSHEYYVPNVTIWNNLNRVEPRWPESPYWYYTSPTVSTTTYGSAICYSNSLGLSQNQNSGLSRSMNCCSTAASPSATSTGGFDLGTKFSDKSIEDGVTNTDFKASHILKKIEIYYASKEQLVAMGVPVAQAKEVSWPQAFGGYCKPPKN